ncbi:unnamed protein product [Diamesa hyperborea]
MKICLVILAVLAVSFVTQCESKAFHFHPFRLHHMKERTNTGFIKKFSFHGHHGKIFNFNSIFQHGAQASAPVESVSTTTTTTTSTEAPQTPKSTGGHGFKKHFNINWSYNFNHGSAAVDSNANANVETVTASTTEKPFEDEMKIEDFGTSFDTNVDDSAVVEDSHDDTFSFNTDNTDNETVHEAISETVNEPETGLIANEYLPPKY